MKVKSVIKVISGKLYALQIVPSMKLIKLLRSYGSKIEVTMPLWINDEINN
jgi:hypothetical protein